MRTILLMGSKLPCDILVIVLITSLVNVTMEQVIGEGQDEECHSEDRRVAVALARNDDYLDDDCTDGPTVFCRFAAFICQLRCLFNRYSSYTCTPQDQCICHGIGGPEDQTRGDNLCSYTPRVCQHVCTLTWYAAYNCTANNQCVCLGADGNPKSRGDALCSYTPTFCRWRCSWSNYLYFDCNENNKCLCNDTLKENPKGNGTNNGSDTYSGNDTYTTITLGPEPETTPDPNEGGGDVFCMIPQLCKIRCKVWFKLDFTCRYQRICRCRGKKDSAPKGDKTCRYWKLFCKLYCLSSGMSGRCTRKDECECYREEEGGADGGEGDNTTAPERRDIWCSWPNACKARCLVLGLQKYTCETKQCLCHARGARPEIPDTAMAMAFASSSYTRNSDTVCGSYYELVKACWFYCLVFRMSYIGMCDDDSKCMC